MKTYLTLSAIALAAAASLSSGVASAEEPAAAPVPDIAVTSNFGLTSDYRFRGISQNNRSPSAQGGFDVAFNKFGLYVGTWGSNVNAWTAGNGSMEWDLYGGYKTEVAGIAVDVGLIDYQYPGSGSYKANTQEAYVGLGYGIASFKVSRTIGDNYFATTNSTGTNGVSAKGTMYYDMTLSQEVLPKLTASAHAGYTDYKADGALSAGKFSYADYNVGLSYDYNGFLLGVKYYFNTLKNGTKSYADATAALATGSTLSNGKSNLGASGVALSLTRSF
jgi:uncharacterized protein (TIGR02001 family)